MSEPKERAPYMPQLLKAVADAAGIEATIKLAKFYRGRRVYVPKTAAPNHPLIQAVGVKAADAVMKLAGGANCVFPTASHTIRLMVATELVARGATNNQIVVQTGISYPQAKRLRAKAKKLIEADVAPYGAIARANGYGQQQDMFAQPMPQPARRKSAKH